MICVYVIRIILPSCLSYPKLDGRTIQGYIKIKIADLKNTSYTRNSERTKCVFLDDICSYISNTQ